MIFLYAFLIGGALCVIAQLVVDFLPFTPGHVMVGFVVAGVIAGALGLYEPLIKFAGAGAAVPLSGFGSLLAKGVFKETQQSGLLGAFTGGLRAGAAGILAAIVFALLASLVAQPKH